MRNNPSYVLDFCTIKTTDNDTMDNMVIFEGFDLSINRSMDHNSFGNSQLDTELIVKGKFVRNVAVDDFKKVTFDIQEHRTNIIEILKHGQFIKMSGYGIITEWEFPKDNDGVFKITIKVHGEIN